MRKLKLEQQDQLEVVDSLASHPESGTPIKNAGILRKMRVKYVSRRIGKRSGLRVIYYFDEENREVWPLDVFYKGDKANLTPNEVRELEQLARSLGVAID